MQGVTHSIVGIATSFSIYSLEGNTLTLTNPSSLINLPLLVIVGLVVGQLPDLDNIHSNISNLSKYTRRSLKFKTLLSKILFWLLNIPFQLISRVVILFSGKHRGIIHSLAASIMATLVFYLCFKSIDYSLIFFCVYLSHLVIDSFTIAGIKFLYPLSDYSFHTIPFPFKSNSQIHNTVVIYLADIVIIVISIMMVRI